MTISAPCIFSSPFFVLFTNHSRYKFSLLTTPISILIPTLNEENYIKPTLESLFNSDYSEGDIEILVLDGGSIDSTRNIVSRLSKSNHNLRLIDNPKKTVAAAMNIGRKLAQHELLVWVGAHAIFPQGYLTKLVTIKLTERCGSVGGVITPIGKSSIGQTIANVTQSWLGTGGAKYRYAKQRQSVETVYGGIFFKEEVDQAGGFNESWIRNQDAEFNARLKEHVGEIVLDPSIKLHYYCRESFPGLFSQYFQYGYWRCKTFLTKPNSFGLRQALPLLLLLGFCVSFILLLLNHSIGAALPTTYTTIVCSASALIALRHKTWLFLFLAPIAFGIIHLAWPIGFFCSLFESTYKTIIKTFHN